MKTVVAIILLLSASAPVQDVEWVRAWEQAQRSKPARVASAARIAPADEPGQPLVIDGRVYQSDGRTPAAGITVFAYQTDARGVYDERSAGPHSWRLKGWALTDAEGRFSFQTIRPASYPNASVPQHIHLTIEGPGVPRRSVSDIEFDDDPKVTPRQRQESLAAGQFGGVRPVTRRDGTDRVEVSIRIAPGGLF